MQEVNKGNAPPEQSPHAFGQAFRTKLRDLHRQSVDRNLLQQLTVSLHSMHLENEI